MFVKVTRSGPRRYVQLVEAFRNDEGKVKHRTIATLGRLDKLGEELNAVVDGLARVTGRTLPDSPSIEFQTAKSFGDIWALTQLWSQGGFDQLRKAFRGSRFSVPVEKLIELMVLNCMTSPTPSWAYCAGWTKPTSTLLLTPARLTTPCCCVPWMR